MTAVSAGWFHSCAIADDDVYCWGSNSSGKLGDGTTTASSVPVRVQGLGSGITEVSANDESCAIVHDSALCRGINGYGNLGDGTVTDSSSPVAVMGLSTGVTDIAAGGLCSCAVVDGVKEVVLRAPGHKGLIGQVCIRDQRAVRAMAACTIGGV